MSCSRSSVWHLHSHHTLQRSSCTDSSPTLPILSCHPHAACSCSKGVSRCPTRGCQASQAHYQSQEAQPPDDLVRRLPRWDSC